MTSKSTTYALKDARGGGDDLSWIEPEGEPVPMAQFGKDHWSTFAYIETRIVDYRGVLEHDHMRCSELRHPLWVGAGTRAAFVGTGMTNGSAYATRLKGEETEPGRFGVVEMFDHDDYDCALDLIAAGLLEVTMPQVGPGGFYEDAWGRAIKDDGERIEEGCVTGLVEAYLGQYATFSLTPRGAVVASELRAHKGGGGNFHSFVLSPVAAE